MTYYSKRADKPHEIVALIGSPASQTPYVNLEYPDVPTGAFVDHWVCGCSATPCGFGSTSLRWAQCAEHRDIDAPPA